jgi:hypothetical protein
VGIGLPEIGSGVVFGTTISLPSTLTLIVSTGGGAGLVSVVAIIDILIQFIVFFESFWL